MHETAARPERAFLVGVRDQTVQAPEADSLIRELASLADTQGIEVVGSMVVPLRERTAALLLGSGKADEITQAAKAADADSIIFDTPLSPVQQRNWEKLSGLSVYDRSELIIKIFAGRAHTREASLQVELARLQYALPRLTHSYEDLHRQRGGRYGTKGSGEQKIELDRRAISERIRDIKEELKDVRKSRDTQRRRRERLTLPRAAIVGYTNAGKSSLLNALSRAQVLAEDKLFATLDPTTRRLEGKHGPVLLTDTVGFVRNLPHGLVEAFKATLEEAAGADLLVHVLDASDPESDKHWKTTCEVLSSIGADLSKSVVVYNKIDKLPDRNVMNFLAVRHERAVFTSVPTGEGLDELRSAIVDAIEGERGELTLRVPPERYDLVSLLYSQGAVLSEDHDGQASIIRCRVGERLRPQVEAFIDDKDAAR
ncbi:MAG: GTPase HflX [Spirochaetales bacterium]|nr:GTPase HflX [Spirochaetales bacterium]MBP7264960.1 GTPase HflX [Spirochaetia bacterium]